MEAYELIIEAKVNTSAFSIVSPDDFQYHRGGSLDPHLVVERPNISLYCLDHAQRWAIFVETDPSVDLLQEPFYFVAQCQVPPP